MTDHVRVDPRVVRTKQRLIEALLGQIQQRRWEKITVQDILTDSGISRSAFYTHYSDKYDLLTSGMPAISLPTVGDGRPDFEPLFVHVDGMADVLRPLLTQPVLSEVMSTFHQRFVDTWSSYLSTTRHADDPVLAQFLAGSISALVKSYALENDREDPQVFSARVTAHLNRVLDT